MNFHSNKTYKEKSYWDERYTNEKSYEWFLSYTLIKDLLFGLLKKEDRTLILGKRCVEILNGR